MSAGSERRQGLDLLFRLAWTAVAGAGLLLLLLVARAALLRPAEEAAVAPVAVPALEAAAIERLAAAIRIPTATTEGTATPDAPFQALHAHLAASFPRVHAALAREAVGRHALLFTWKGADPSLEPVVLAAHQDVVPVDPATASQWTHAPFAGEVADGFIWGRGALDDKAAVLGILEAAETLLAEGFAPRRTVMFAFGADEEIGGTDGAGRIATLLRERGLKPAFVLDEGMIVSQGLVPGVSDPVALVAVSEKGYATLELTARLTGGHSSMPPAETAVGVLARAVARLEAQPFPAHLEVAARPLLETLAPHMPFGPRLALGNLWLFAPVVERQMAAVPSSNASLRTTTAVTVLRAGLKENVLAAEATAVVNFRILPGDTVKRVEEHVREVVADPRMEIKVRPGASDPSPVSPTDSPWYALMARSIRGVYPEARVAPSLMLGATDGRFYTGVTPNVYRFLPVTLTPEDLARFHGTDERVAVADYQRAVAFYRELVRGAQK